MNINMNNEVNSFHQESSRSMLIQKIFKFTSIFVGIVVIIMITFDIGDKIFRSYKEGGESYRILQESDYGFEFNEETENQQESMIDNLNISIIEETPHLEITNEEKEIVLNFYDKVDRVNYRGKWSTNENFEFLSERTEGEIVFKMDKITSFSSLIFDKIFFVFKLLDGHYIDKWTLVRSVNRPLANITITNSSFTQQINSVVDFGEIFERVEYTNFNKENNSSLSSCKSTIFIDWANNTDYSKNITNMNGYFNSDCGFNNFTFQLSIDTEDDDSHKIMLYSIVVTLLALSQIFNTVWMTMKINDSQTLANSLSLVTVLQNIVWNAYGCLCHFFLTVNYDIYTLQFGIPAFLYFANFSIFELKLLYTIWRMKNMRYVNDQATLRKKLVQFYFMFYIIMFFSLFYVMKFFFEKPYIFAAISFTWIPQIIYNAIYKNRISLPILNILLTCLNKVFLPFYFRGCPDNFFQLSHDYSFVLFCFICIVLETCFLYSQTLFGPRWFLPKRYNKIGFNFFKTKSEVLIIRPDAEFHDCVICLFSLLSNENYKHFSDDFLAAAGDETFRKNKNVCKRYLEEYKYFWSNFHEFSFDINKKPYMMTPCRHIFHTPCLESWFKEKKECPSCRQDIDEHAEI